jgi:hypothetical protein
MNYKRVIEVQIDEGLLVRALGNDLHEGQWRKDGGFIVRVDPANPGTRTDRHVTIALPKHATAKNKQVSWTDSGARHDRSTFNAGLPGLNKAKALARRVLKLSANVVMEEVTGIRTEVLIEQVAKGADVTDLVEQFLDDDDASVIRLRVVVKSDRK